MAEEKFYLGRQPILNRKQRIVGFELLFRSANTLHANVTDYLQASASVIFNSLSTFGFEEILGRHMGFVNVNIDVLMSDALELLPKEQVVIELLETIEVTDRVVERCLELKEKGFRLALDDNLFEPRYEPLYEIVDIVKVDILLTTMDALPGMIREFKRWNLLLLAEKVETVEQYEQCLEMGFDFFQGYYFAKPVILTKLKVDISRVTLVKLFNQLLADAEIKEVEDTFKHDPKMTYSLLRLVNSVSIGSRARIKSLRHAIMVLGFQQLRRWAMMALFAFKEARGMDNPLLVMAAMRGRLMELMVRQQPLPWNDNEYPDRAFMTGILSMIDILIGASMEEVTAQLNLADDVRMALLARQGELGNLLKVAEHLEKNEFSTIEGLLGQSRFTVDNLVSAQMDMLVWLKSLDDYV